MNAPEQPRRIQRPQPEEVVALVQHLLSRIDAQRLPRVTNDTLVWAAQLLLVEGVEVER